MQVQIQKWGNSAAVRLPAPVLRDAGITLGQALELTVEDGKLIFAPKKEYKLEIVSEEPLKFKELYGIYTNPLKGNESW